MGALQHTPKPKTRARTGHVSPGRPIRGTLTEDPLPVRGFFVWLSFRFGGAQVGRTGR